MGIVSETPTVLELLLWGSVTQVELGDTEDREDTDGPDPSLFGHTQFFSKSITLVKREIQPQAGK